MAGLSKYVLTLLAGETRTLTVRGNFVYLHTASTAVEFGLRQYEIGERSGREYKLEMRQNEKWNAAEEFDNVTIRNAGSGTIQVTFFAGYGNYTREVPGFTGVAGFFSGDSVTLNDGSGAVELIDTTSGRKKIRIYIEADDPGAYVQFGPTAPEIAGPKFYSGDSFELETESAIFVQGADFASGNILVSYLEERYNA